MNKEATKLQILMAVSRRLENGYHGTLQKVLKTNMELDGLTIVKAGENTAPTIYLDFFYEALESGTSIDAVADRILQIYSDSKICPEHFDTAP